MTDEPKPIPIIISSVAPIPIVASTTSPISTPAEESEIEKHSFGQRRVNLIWEITQASIALTVTISTLYVSTTLAMRDSGKEAAFLLLSDAFFLVVGFYFGRTNHQKVGGVEQGR